jgi:hypothetical protein
VLRSTLRRRSPGRTTVAFPWPVEYRPEGILPYFAEFPAAAFGRFQGDQKARFLLWSRNVLESGDTLRIVPSIGAGLSTPLPHGYHEMR